MKGEKLNSKHKMSLNETLWASHWVNLDLQISLNPFLLCVTVWLKCYRDDMIHFNGFISECSDKWGCNLNLPEDFGDVKLMCRIKPRSRNLFYKHLWPQKSCWLYIIFITINHKAWRPISKHMLVLFLHRFHMYKCFIIITFCTNKGAERCTTCFASFSIHIFEI